MLISILFLLVGFVILIKGADFLIDGASSFAKKMSISEIAIGLTIVAFGTSAPELIVNVFASIGGHHEITFGNILGSNIFNILMVLGISGIISTIMVQRNTILKEIPFLLAATLLVFGLSLWNSDLSFVDGIILILFLIIFFVYVIVFLKAKPLLGSDIKERTYFMIIVMITAGVTGLFFGGKFVVDNAVIMARHFNVSEKFIGLTIVALGTSLPELVTSVMAISKGRNDLAIGNVIGSNLFNILLVLGVSSLISPVHYDVTLNIDFIFLCLITLMLFLSMFIGKKHRLTKGEAITFVFLYCAYLVFLFIRK
ncbi:MAG: calcium/sodium antiporter [Candidatus Tenebribacter davisii]|jgi:cation:H+ antiporter|nr:calcium/sodium antiporter [Candidatus Tenebribacter davisii]